MIEFSYNVADGSVKLVRSATIKVGGDVPVRVNFSATPGLLSALQLALGTDAAAPTVLAFTEDFSEESETVWTALLDASDTRLVAAMVGKQVLTVNAELVAVIDGEKNVAPSVSITVQQRVVSGPTSSEGGPVYLTTGQIATAIDAALDDALGNVDNTSDATKNAAAVTITNHTLAASNVVSPAARMFPPWFVVVGDSVSSAGTQYWPAGFAGTSTGLTGSPNSYNVVFSYAGADATGVKPLTSWPEKFLALAGASPQSYNFAYAGRYLTDARKYDWQEAHLTSPRLTGIPAGIVIYVGINDLSQVDTSADIWGRLQDVAGYARADGYAPIVISTLQSTTTAGADFRVGGAWDVKRLAVNAAITGSSGVADVIVDVTTVTGLAATNAPTTGNAYTHNATNYVDGLHFSAAGNGLFAAALFAGVKAWAGTVATRTQVVPVTMDSAVERCAPWAQRCPAIADFTVGSTGGTTYDGEGKLGAIGIRNGATNADFAVAHWAGVFMGATRAWNGSEGVEPRAFVDWGRPVAVAFSFMTEFGSTDYSHSTWQATFLGRAGGTAALLVGADLAIGIKITRPDTATVRVYASASNGTTNSLTLLGEVADSAQHNVVLASDGNGNLRVTLDGVTTTIAGVTPFKQISTNRAVQYESNTTGGDGATGYVYFGVPVITTW